MKNSNTDIKISARSIDELINVSNGISFKKEDELFFIKSCLFYLKEGVNSNEAINMAMVDYLLEY